MMVLYTLMLFSDYVSDPAMRSNIGVTYMVIVIAFAVVHLCFLFRASFKQLYRKIKRCY